MRKAFNFKDSLPQAKSMLEILLDTISFIRTHKLWKGFFENRWIFIVSILISIGLSVSLFNNLFPDELFMDKLAIAGLDKGDAEMINNIKKNGKEGAITSGSKYLVMIMLEILIFYISSRTFSILTLKEKNPLFKDFVKAQIRMIKIMIISFFKGIMMSVILGVILGLVGLSGISSVAMFFVYAYFIGYAFLDNYNEQNEITRKDSLSKVRKHVGASTLLGVVVSGIFYIPLIGPLIGPIIGAIAAVRYGHRYHVELS